MYWCLIVVFSFTLSFGLYIFVEHPARKLLEFWYGAYRWSNKKPLRANLPGLSREERRKLKEEEQQLYAG